ncbi:major facilitator superfamily domain-containing protein [Cokeromyces recurvatus]|uniref:major facilitator superfamily domain-containing protein n=1 Tax=Cokeromyces recurvatus TaxID=90255 RepID=UPI00222057E3|nr:major facilitator superfamily domain-containing protein [Cokeromyces recurvatus]KAI7900817.1 major facilitator superfamily domain-containing protein [Cokeromyces recurvatus]
MISNMLIALICILSIGFVPYISEKDWLRILLISICCFGYAFFGYPVIAAIVDTVILKVLGDRKDELYGKQKIGVPIGFALSVFLTGFLTEYLNSSYALFIVFGFSNICFILTVWRMIDLKDEHVETMNVNNDDDNKWLANENDTSYGVITPSSSSSAVFIEDDTETDETIAFIKKNEETTVSMWHLLKDPESCQFFFSMMLIGYGIAVVQAFLYLFIKNDLHGTPTMIGLLGPLGSSTEVICFFFSKEIIHRLGSSKMLIIAQFLLIYRCITYIICIDSSSYGSYWATATQLLHGIGFSMTWSAGALKADEIAPIHLKSSAQGLLNMAFNGLGSGLGALIAGFIYERWGAKIMWFFTGCIGALSIFIYTSLFVRRVLFLPISNLIKTYK